MTMQLSLIDAEQWRDIPGYEGHFQVSDHGRVMNCYNGMLVKQSLKGSKGYGYPGVSLTHNGTRKTFTTHRLVVLAFIGERPNGAEINHINGDKLDAHLANLEYVTHQQNMTHAADNNLMASGARHFKAVLTEQAVVEMRDLWNSGLVSLTEIAKRYNASKGVVWQALAQITWKKSVRPHDVALVPTYLRVKPNNPDIRRIHLDHRASKINRPALPMMPTLNELTTEQLAFVQQWQNQRLAMNEAAAEGKFTFADGCLTIMREIEQRLGFRPAPLVVEETAQ